jgi:hypothetical protein
MELKLSRILVIFAILLCLVVLPASAVMQEVTLKGVVQTLIPGQNTLSIENVWKYGCDYPAEGDPVCSFTKLSSNIVSGTVPDSMAFSVFKEADTIAATSIGGTGGTWISLGKLYGPGPGEEFVTDLVGDPAAMPVPFVGDYAITYTNAPDCTACSGLLCKASSSTVTVLANGNFIAEKKINPRQTFTVNPKNDGSSITITFVEGQASNEACAGSREGSNAGPVGTGPQAVSDFIVDVVPPIGYTPGATQPTLATPAAPALTAATQAPVPPTTHSPLSPAAILGALGLAGILIVARRG